ncbi:MAG: cobalamin-binding protein [Treponema sp.]|jgi:iron complex transport system substrate-binding protein|nr:cobalamin-binding protein [Treponema sp.]
MNRRYGLVLCFFFLLSSGIPVPAQDFPLALTDALDRTIVLRAPARRIVSLSPSVTEILFAVGAGDAVAGVTQYCNYPAEAASKPKVGGFSGATVSIETIAALRPDLVILSADMHGRIVSLLDRIGIVSLAVEPRNFDEVYGLIAGIGRLTGKRAGAEAVLAEMREKLRRAGEQGRGRKAPRVFWELSANPLITAGGSSFISEAIRLAGGENIFGDLEEHWPEVNVEAVLRRRPDWIISAETGDTRALLRSLARRPGWGSLPAVRAGRAAAIDPDSISRYGPRLADAVLILAGIFYGE